ncbi:MAG TPA: HNH endonuclease signature motif containing protein [Dissulfurispiraceae bacterium]|nr:HNH endonuclease signature motif containing protein [Dissulfurispiraceae bacterium]
MGKVKRLYDSVRWRKARIWWLNSHPLCVMCLQQGRDTAATVIDHIIPHNDDYEKFWDSNNWQSLCASCHSGVKQMQELHGYSQAAGVDGQPIDKNHPWNRGRGGQNLYSSGDD